MIYFGEWGEKVWFWKAELSKILSCYIINVMYDMIKDIYDFVYFIFWLCITDDQNVSIKT